MFFIKNNLSILLLFIAHPGYLLRMVLILMRHPLSTLDVVYRSLCQKKTTLILEYFYQRFNEELMKCDDEKKSGSSIVV